MRPAGRIALAGATLLLAPAVLAQGQTPAAPAAEAQPAKIGVLRGLDKITARVSTFEVPVGADTRFGTLAIKLDACDKRPPEEAPETTAFVEIDEIRADDGAAIRIFSGWMFASSPALSALEHPVYDVWVIDCKKASSSASEVSAAN